MAVTISFTLSNADAQLVQDAFTITYGYVPTLPDGSANPESEAQFTKRQIQEFIKQVVRAYRVNVAVEAARQAENQKPDPGIA